MFHVEHVAPLSGLRMLVEDIHLLRNVNNFWSNGKMKLLDSVKIGLPVTVFCLQCSSITLAHPYKKKGEDLI